MKTRNRRRWPRVNESLRAYIVDLDDEVGNVSPVDLMIEARTVDFSSEGLQIETGCTLKDGAYVIAIVFTNENKSFCFCRVMWRQRKGPVFRYGLYFKEWSFLDSKLQALLPTNKTFFDFLRRPLKNPTSKAA